MRDESHALDDGETDAVCSSVCTSPSEEEALTAAIDRLTRALATAPDDAILELVAERRALREELRLRCDEMGPRAAVVVSQQLFTDTYNKKVVR